MVIRFRIQSFIQIGWQMRRSLAFKERPTLGHGLFIIAIPKPSSKLKAKLGMALLSVLVRRPQPSAAVLRTYLNQGLSSQPGARFSYIWSQPGISLMPGWRQVKTLACRCRNPGQTKALCSWPLAKGHVPSPLSFIQSLSQGVAQLSQIFWNLKTK